MPRSLKKGPYVHASIVKHLGRLQPGSRAVIKTWSRSSMITPTMLGYTFAVHNGKNFIEIRVVEDMVGHRLGEFAPTRKFVRHGGKIQKSLDQQQQQQQK